MRNKIFSNKNVLQLAKERLWQMDIFFLPSPEFSWHNHIFPWAGRSQLLLLTPHRVTVKHFLKFQPVSLTTTDYGILKIPISMTFFIFADFIDSELLPSSTFSCSSAFSFLRELSKYNLAALQTGLEYLPQDCRGLKSWKPADDKGFLSTGAKTLL